MSDEVTLLPCPFCGSADARFDQIEFQIVCRNIDCAAHPHVFDTNTEAIAAWNTRPTVVTDEVVERLVRDAYEEGVEDGIGWHAYPESSPRPEWIDSVARVEFIKAARSAIAAMPTVVTGQPQGLGVPASPSSHSRAEPEEVSALRASVPNAADLADSENDIRGAEMLEQTAKRTRSKSHKAALIATAAYLRCRAGQVA